MDYEILNNATFNGTWELTELDSQRDIKNRRVTKTRFGSMYTRGLDNIDTKITDMTDGKLKSHAATLYTKGLDLINRKISSEFRHGGDKWAMNGTSTLYELGKNLIREKNNKLRSGLELEDLYPSGTESIKDKAEAYKKYTDVSDIDTKNKNYFYLKISVMSFGQELSPLYDSGLNSIVDKVNTMKEVKDTHDKLYDSGTVSMAAKILEYKRTKKENELYYSGMDEIESKIKKMKTNEYEAKDNVYDVKAKELIPSKADSLKSGIDLGTLFDSGSLSIETKAGNIKLGQFEETQTIFESGMQTIGQKAINIKDGEIYQRLYEYTTKMLRNKIKSIKKGVVLSTSRLYKSGLDSFANKASTIKNGVVLQNSKLYNSGTSTIKSKAEHLIQYLNLSSLYDSGIESISTKAKDIKDILDLSSISGYPDRSSVLQDKKEIKEGTLKNKTTLYKSGVKVFYSKFLKYKNSTLSKRLYKSGTLVIESKVLKYTTDQNI